MYIMFDKWEYCFLMFIYWKKNEIGDFDVKFLVLYFFFYFFEKIVRVVFVRLK